MDKKLNPAQRRANARLAVKDAKRLLTAGLAWLDAGDTQRARAYFEGAQGAAFDAKAILDPFHPREDAYAAGSNDPAFLLAKAYAPCSVCGDDRHTAAQHNPQGAMATPSTA